MSTQPKVGTNVHTFLCPVEILEGERVSFTGSNLGKAGATANRLGVATRDVAAGEYGPIRLCSAPSAIYKTDATITVGANVFGAANGKVATTGGGNEPIGIALTATGGTAGELVEVAHNNNVS